MVVLRSPKRRVCGSGVEGSGIHCKKGTRGGSFGCRKKLQYSLAKWSKRKRKGRAKAGMDELGRERRGRREHKQWQGSQTTASTYLTGCSRVEQGESEHDRNEGSRAGVDQTRAREYSGGSLRKQIVTVVRPKVGGRKRSTVAGGKKGERY